MPAHRKPTPEKYCEACGKKLERKLEPDGDLESLTHFNRRKYCDQKCFGMGTKNKPKKATVLRHQGRYRARQVKPLTPCELCGSTRRVDRHHRDENPLNNDPANIQNLCRKCHMKHHDLPSMGGKASAKKHGTANIYRKA